MDQDAGSEKMLGNGDHLSASGMFVATDAPRKKGETLSIRFSIPDGSGPISAVAEVVWTREASPDGSAAAGMGVRFTRIDEKDAERIRKFVRGRQEG
jgi:uncharacterized protein (TIGR02266 family)